MPQLLGQSVAEKQTKATLKATKLIKRRASFHF